MFHFYSPLKTFSGGKEMIQWTKMGSKAIRTRKSCNLFSMKTKEK